MSAIFIRKHFNIRNLRKFLVYSSSHNSNLRLTKPCLNRVVQHECLSSLAHNYKPTENSNLREKTEDSSKDSVLKDMDNCLLSIDQNVKRSGRVRLKEVVDTLSIINYRGASCTDTQGLYLLRCCGLIREVFPNERVKLADEIWKKLQDLGCKFDITHYNAILRVYVESNHQFLPADFLASLESKNIEPNRTTFLLLIQKFCNEGNLNGSSEILEFMREKELPICENIFNALITGHMNAGDVSGAKDIFDVMRSSNLSPSGASYATLACGYATKGDIDGVESVLQDVQQNNLTLSPDDYLSIIASLPSDEHLAFIDEALGCMGESVFDCKQEVLNTVLDLLNKNLYESAYKLVLSICNSEEGSKSSTNVFLRQLIKSKQPIDKVLHYCEDIESRGLNNFTFVNSAKIANETEQFDIALSLFKRMLEKGIPVRTNYFWPMLSESKSEKDLMSALATMFQMGILADFSTFTSFVFPHMDVSNPETVLTKIQETGHTGFLDPLFTYYCHNGYSDQALYLTKKYSFSVISTFNLEKFIISHSAAVQKDPHSAFYQVLSFILQNIFKFATNSDAQRGSLLANLILLNPSVFQTWLKSSGCKDFYANSNCLDACYNILSRQKPDLLVHLNRLESSVSSSRKYKTMKTMTIEEENNQLNYFKAQGYKVEIFLHQLLGFHLKMKNMERVNQLLVEAESVGFVLSPMICAQLFHHYKIEGDIEAAGKILKTLRENHPTFNLDIAQVLNYVMQLIQYGKSEEAIQTIKTECKELRIHGSRDFALRTLKRFFDVVVETGDIDLVRNVQSSLVHLSKDIKYPKVLYEPLVKMHLFRNDLDGAVQEFKSIAKQNNVTPCVLHLLKECIFADDHAKVEKVVDSVSNVHGRNAGLRELFIALLESGRAQKAFKLLTNMGHNLNFAFLEEVCLKFVNDDKPRDLREFLFMIRDIRSVESMDQAKLFTYLFKLYENRNDYKNALELYRVIQEEQLFVIDEKIAFLLTKLCEKNNVAVPSNICSKEIREESAITKIKDESIDNFHHLLEKGDTFQALDKLYSMKKGLIRALPLDDMAQFIKLVVEKNLVQQLSENIQAMSYIIDNVNGIFPELYAQYADAGDIESLMRLSKLLPDFSLKASSFNNSLTKAYLACGKQEELLTEMEHRCQSSNKMFTATTFFKILSFPDLQERAINLAKKYSENKFNTPVAVLWAYYVTNENHDAANELAKQYPLEYEKADTIVMKTVKVNENVALGRMFIDKLNEQNARPRSRIRAYGILLDVLVSKENYSEAADLVVESSKNGLNLVNHFTSTLLTLKIALERENKSVPFTIPAEKSGFFA